MIDKQNNTIKCEHCNMVIEINKEKLKKWCTRQHINRLEKSNKHYCSKCTTQLGFYSNGVVIL